MEVRELEEGAEESKGLMVNICGGKDMIQKKGQK